MAFNASHLRALRTQKNQQVRARSFSKTSNNLPFIEPRQFDDGEFQFHIWPADSTKNPFGYLYYRIHTLHDRQDKPVKFCCPRSNNWEPIPAITMASPSPSTMR